MASNNPKPKRGPTVLVTDTRDARPAARPSTKLISVDNVLQYASDLPSQQRRLPPGGSPRPPISPRTPSGRHPLEPRLSGRPGPWANTAAGGMPQQHVNMPSRASKVSERLVMLPETARGAELAQLADEEDEDEERNGDNRARARARDDGLLEREAEDDDRAPPSDRVLAHRRRQSDGRGDKSWAERLPKAQRSRDIARVTAYGVAQAYKLRATAEFVRERHGARTKLYDDCLYTVYHLPLLPGEEGYRVRSSPVLKSPGGKAVLDEEIERNERREYREGYFEDGEEGGYAVKNDGEGRWEFHQDETPPEEREQERYAAKDSERQHEHDEYAVTTPPREGNQPHHTDHERGRTIDGHPLSSQTSSNDASTRSSSPFHLSRSFAEMFVFSYGVVVFWNFTETQEKDILADLTFASSPTGGSLSLATRPQPEQDFETEELHFEYNTAIPRPRLFNDMITLRSGDHMIKLTMSHAVAQSTKLSFFEARMGTTMLEAQYVPKRLALTGRLGMRREDVVKILGRLYTSRVEVNLSSNMLDVPNFFWDAEPHLHPLYVAVREYLEIESRIKVLNERCKVFLELAEMLGEAVADKKMSRLTWIIIVLIVISIFVTCSETLLRYGILSKSEQRKGMCGEEGLEGLQVQMMGQVPTALVGSNMSGWLAAGCRWALRLLGPGGGLALLIWKRSEASPWSRL
ncbi:MAG: hypothetical protein M1821_009238 [Bathelium mastoideum]|nr:MAG: hypothetical protein M1821_009238 [Bathelium mastoideum]